MINSLPIELIRKIRFYALPTQNKNLLRDIIHFKTSLEIIKKTIPVYPMNGAQHLLLNDLWVTVGRIMGATPGQRRTPNYMSPYYQIWLRMFRLYNIKSAERWIRSYYALKPTKVQIRLVWAIFIPEEREEFISWQKKIRGFIV